MKIANEIEPRKEFKEKKKAILIPSIFASLCCLIVISVLLFNPKSGIISTHSDPGASHTMSRAKELLSYEVMALGNMVPSSSQTALKGLKNDNLDYQQANELTNEIHDYLLTGEMMLNKENVVASNEVNTNSEYSYENKLSVTYKDQSEYSFNYVLYYTETKKIESDRKIDEVGSYLSGVMVVADKEYNVKGEKEVEKDEIESELKIFMNANSYIKISQETEKNENEYQYEYVENGKTIKELSLEVEEKWTSKKMTLEIFENNVEKEFEFEYKKSHILCSYQDETKDEEYEINIEVYNEYYLYVFNKDLKIKKNK